MVSTLEKLISDIFSKINIEYGKFVVSVKFVEWNVSTLIDYYRRGIVQISPELQRSYVWDNVKASRFIESLYLRFPIPPIMLLKYDENLYYVIDGVQRLTTVVKFVDNKLILDTQIVKKIRNKRFSELSERDKTLFLTAPFPVQVIEIKGDETVKTLVALEIFRRINLGSVKLNFTQVLFCSVPTASIMEIKRLARSESFNKLFSFTDREVVKFKPYYMALVLTLAFKRGEPLNMEPSYRERYKTDIRELILTPNIDLVKRIVDEVEATCRLALEIGLGREYFMPATYGIYRRAKKNVVSTLLAQVILLALRSIAEPVVEDGKIVKFRLPGKARGRDIVNAIVDAIVNFREDGRDIRSIYTAIVRDGRTSLLKQLYRKVEDAVKLVAVS